MEKSKKMKEYFCIFLFLIGGCAFEVDRMLPYHCNGKNNDMQIKMNGTDWENSQQYFNNIMIEKKRRTCIADTAFYFFYGYYIFF